MLNDFRQFQFALARHLRDPLGVSAPAGVSLADAAACTQDMVTHVSEVLAPAFPVTCALLGDDMWEHAVRLFLKDAQPHTPWASTTQRAFVDHVCESPDMQRLPAWLQDLAHFEWLQNAVNTTPVSWPACDVDANVMHHAVVLNPTHVEAAYEWPVHSIDTDHQPDDMQSTYVSMLRDKDDTLHVLESNVFRGQLIDLLRDGQSGEQAFMVLAMWLSHPEPEAFVREGAEVMAQLQREGIVLGARV
nr:putative DNA-binding domain-containing protein [uncultured Limnohabitans sp.]